MMKLPIIMFTCIVALLHNSLLAQKSTMPPLEGVKSIFTQNVNWELSNIPSYDMLFTIDSLDIYCSAVITNDVPLYNIKNPDSAKIRRKGSFYHKYFICKKNDSMGIAFDPTKHYYSLKLKGRRDSFASKDSFTYKVENRKRYYDSGPTLIKKNLDSIAQSFTKENGFTLLSNPRYHGGYLINKFTKDSPKDSIIICFNDNYKNLNYSLSPSLDSLFNSKLYKFCFFEAADFMMERCQKYPGTSCSLEYTTTIEPYTLEDPAKVYFYISKYKQMQYLLTKKKKTVSSTKKRRK